MVPVHARTNLLPAARQVVQVVAFEGQLYSALAGDGFRMLRRAGEEAMGGVADPKERVFAYGVAYVRFALAHREHLHAMFGAELKPEVCEEADVEAGSEAFRLLQRAVAELMGLEPALGDERAPEMPATLAFWSLCHGLSTLILDGRIRDELLQSREAVEALARSTFACWRPA